MTEKKNEVKERVKVWVECHPYLAWWVAFLSLTNVILNLIDAFDLF